MNGARLIQAPGRWPARSAHSWLASLCLLLATLAARAQDPFEAFSPVASYVFAEPWSSHTDDSFSPVVSYLFAEPLPDDITRELRSSAVSFHFLAGLPGPEISATGEVRDEAGAALPGARVFAAVSPEPLVETRTGADGRFLLPPLPGGPYALVASLPGFAPAGLVLEVRAGMPPQTLVLKRLPDPPPVERNEDPVPDRQKPRLSRTSGIQLKSFQDGRWAFSAIADPNRMTLVLTHGWVFCGSDRGGLDGWPTDLAQLLTTAGVASKANILAWDWYDEANTCFLPEVDGAFGPPVDRTRAQGLALGKALHETFGPDYRQPIHFLGHSLGALVNVEAVNYLHGDGATARTRAPQPWDPARTHVTLFDEAEMAVVFGQQARLGAGIGTQFAALLTTPLPISIATSALGFTTAAINDWRNPIPVRSAWVDNYVSLVGIAHPNAVNVCLQQDSVDAIANFNPLAAHSVPMPWYGATVTSPALSVMGFTNSFALRTTLPPTGDAYTPGRLYLQESPARRFDLRLAADDDYTQCQQEIAKLVATEVVGEVKARVQGVVRAVGNVTARVNNWIGERVHWRDLLAGAGPGNATFTGYPGLVFTLGSGAPPRPAGPMGDEDPPPPSNGPAYAWLTVPVPADAAFMVFDFTVTGDGAADSVTCGVNGTNRFSLETQFVVPGTRTSSSRIDVSASAGTDVELFFGLLGATSTDCTLTVEGVRFLTLAAPVLHVLQRDGSQLHLTWPSAAPGYRLESASTINPPNWAQAPGTPVLKDGEFQQSIPLTEESQFFRLGKR